ncbi:hypothetical protein EYF80_012940 [Liparis tanakae]|uniref:Uncharacterized protein n=1 Tax=Liparis tanakae TaxID=230148 RepID=A0A4Z2IGH6_9TELE|nr:hypothetical protein EYF80_012940 [Liparis tanakae]
MKEGDCLPTAPVGDFTRNSAEIKRRVFFMEACDTLMPPSDALGVVVVVVVVVGSAGRGVTTQQPLCLTGQAPTLHCALQRLPCAQARMRPRVKFNKAGRLL